MYQSIILKALPYKHKKYYVRQGFDLFFSNLVVTFSTKILLDQNQFIQTYDTIDKKDYMCTYRCTYTITNT